MKLKIQARLIIGFSVAVALIVAMGVISYISSDSLHDDAALVTHTYEVLGELSEVISNLQDAETGQRGFILTGEEEFLEPYTAALPLISSNIGDVRQLTEDNPLQQRNIDRAEPLVQAKLDELQQTIELRRSEGFESALAVVLTGEGKQIMDQLRAVIADMEAEENSLLVERAKSSDSAATFAKYSAIVGTVVAFLLLGAIAFIISRTSNLNRSIGSVSESSRNLSSSAEEQRLAATQQGSAIVETLATTKQLGVSSRQASDQAEAAAQEASVALNLAQEGNATVQETLKGMSSLNETSGSIGEQILHLSEQIGRIGQITGLVTDIADQTNLLSLNAAVEAARAGEYGRGFAVVATEIRKLADESKRSAAQITELVSEIQDATNSTVMATEEGSKSVEAAIRQVESAGEAFDKLYAAVNRANDSVAQITLNLQQQASGVEQVETAMTSLQEGSNQIDAGIKSTQGEVERLAVVMGELTALA